MKEEMTGKTLPSYLNTDPESQTRTPRSCNWHFEAGSNLTQYSELKTRGNHATIRCNLTTEAPKPSHLSPPPCSMSLFSTISVRRSGEERSERNTYLAQQQSPVPTPFISPGDGIQYTKTPSCSSITPVPGIRAGLPGNWLVLDEHKV